MMKFTILEEESGAHLVPVALARGLLDHKKITGRDIRNCLFYRQGDHFKWCYGLEEFARAGQLACRKLVSDKKLTDKISAKVRKLSQDLLIFARKIAHQDLSKKSNHELAQLYKKLYQLFKKLYPWGTLVEVAEVYHSFFSSFVQSQLEKFLTQKKTGQNAAILFSLLTAPTKESMGRQQEESFLKLLGRIQRTPKVKKIFKQNSVSKMIGQLTNHPIDKAINKHLDKYRAVNYNYEGPALDKKTLVQELKNALAITKPGQELKKLAKAVRETKKQQEKTMAKLAPDATLKRLLLLSKEFTTIKFIRKERLAHGHHAKDLLHLEASRRFNITLNQARCMLPEEFVALLEKGKLDRAELKAREKELAYLMIDGQEKIVSGLEARQLSRLIAKPKLQKTDKIQGTVASPGQARGAVKIIAHPKDMAKMNQGDILVASATNPAFLPAMKKAAAIVTDMGGLTCHAAIVSRELNIPCVVGTKTGTKVLKDGQIVEVDANKGIVKIIKN